MKRSYALLMVFVVGFALVAIPPVSAVIDVDCDFNGDGYADLAVGVSQENVGATADAGMVNVLYGTSGDLSEVDSESITVGPEASDHVGGGVVCGDFDGDGYDDLAIGASGEDLVGVSSVGQVYVMYGSKNGLVLLGFQSIDQQTTGIGETREANDFFGTHLAVGNFDGDAYDDLVISAHGEDIAGVEDAGLVHIVHGSTDGLDPEDSQIWHQDAPGVKEVNEVGDQLGQTLTTGDFNGDRDDDLAIGLRRESVGGVAGAGKVLVLFGSGSGLSAVGDEIWHQNKAGIKGVAETNDWFGVEMTAGDFDGDGKDDLAIGAHGEDIGVISDAGSVNVIYGSTSGLTKKGDDYWHQNQPGIKGGAEIGDWFGVDLAAGDFDGDGDDDLVVSVRHEDLGSIENAGRVQILQGSPSGLTDKGDEEWSQDTKGVKGVAGEWELFGAEFAVADFNGDGAVDLAISAPWDDVAGVEKAGSVNVLLGSANGLTAKGDQLISQEEIEVPEASDFFGTALTG